MSARHLLLIDASGFAYRAYFGMPPRARTDGTPVHAVLGFMSMVSKMLARADRGDPPSHGAAIFDAPGKTFRHKLFPKYKAGRQRPEGLDKQLPVMRHAAQALGLPAIEHTGVEADDLIATLAARAAAQGIRTTIVSVDKDVLQLVKDDEIEVIDPTQRIRYLEADVEKKFGVMPPLMPDLQALWGDSVDNIPGVPGIGKQGAAGLLRRFGTLHNLIRAIDRGDSMGATGTRRAALRRERDNLRTYLKLATLKRDVMLPIALDDLLLHPMRTAHVVEILRALEATDQLHTIIPGERPSRRAIAKPSGDPLEWWREEIYAKGQPVPATPQCGYYQRSLAKGTQPKRARIWHEPELDFVTEEPTGRVILLCEIDGKRVDAYDHWGYLCMAPIDEKQYEKMGQAPAPKPQVEIAKARPPVFGRRKIL